MRRASLVILVSALQSACVSFSTFQVPEPVDHGEIVLGLGATSMVAESDFGFAPELYGRYGVAPKWDIGLKLGGVPPIGLVQADVKRLLVDGGFKLAADLGVSYTGEELEIGSGDSNTDYSFVALYPAIIAGAGAFHGGVKGIYILAGASENEFVTGSVLGLFAGGRLGSRVQLLPEVHLYYGDDVLFTAGLGLQVPLRGR